MIHFNKFARFGSAQFVVPGLAFPRRAMAGAVTESHHNPRDIYSRSSRLARRVSGVFVFTAACEMVYRSGQWYMDDASSMWLTGAAYAVCCIAVLLVCSDV